jgi:hypothetical protein
MSSGIKGNALRTNTLGIHVNKSYALVTETKTLFTVSGLVYVHAIVGEVTTVITVANTVKLQANPTVGTTSDIFAATDIGTTDTPAGNLLSITGAAADGPVSGIGKVSMYGQPVTTPTAGSAGVGLIINTGTIEQVTTGTSPDGVINWHICYVAITDGATIVAA